MEFLIYGITCLFATTVGAISGIGGGVIIKPVFDLFTGFPPAAINFLSGCTVLCMSIVSLLRSRGSAVKVELRRGTLLAAGAALGGIMGKLGFDYIKALAGDDSLVGIVQNTVLALLTLAVCFYMLNKNVIQTKNIRNPAACVLIGMILGVAGAFLGIGGGPINLIVLYYFFSMKTKAAALTSLYIILFSQTTALVSTVCSGKLPEIQLPVLIMMALGGVLGGFLGRGISRKLSPKATDTLFTWVLVLITAISVLNVFRFIAF